MGQACCTYGPKDTNNENFGANKTINKNNSKLFVLDPEAGKKALAIGTAHPNEVIKL